MQYSNQNPALIHDFDEKLHWFLGYLYEEGGGEFKPNHFYSHYSYQLAGCFDSDEFVRLFTALKTNEWVTFNIVPDPRAGVEYKDLLLTSKGIDEVKKRGSVMYGLVHQQIKTGTPDADVKINHARLMFFSEPQTMDNMRSACESLCFVLEPLRDDLTPAITSADVNELFQIVNRFDIRHNKASTKNLIYPEQLEWVFYSLLNTINAYTKLKKRLHE